ncbi:energy-coupling factor ABC transporter ATP-binding protein [Methanopyrus sp. KOL6]|uniref:energy-coupling factor ABC transporter ATP-binding protein n=1 Tax=Methanopyrus sp. KOL6 TaxID=1937004 RepID=UPI0012FA7EF0|nr:energy-coupling factor ABC transporter ATP-binding protein [Methanopyrus sp. KOL6]
MSLRVKEGESVVVLGPNGSGKTTLLHHILGLLTPTEGHIRVLGHDLPDGVREVRKRIGVVFQDVDDQLIMPTVLEDVAFGLVNRGMSREEAFERAREILERLGIEDLEDRPPQFLSGGQKRLVALAGAVAPEPDLLILDEPTSGLDFRATRLFVRLIKELKEELGFTMILTTFDVDIAMALAERVVMIRERKTVAEGSPEDLLTDVDLIKESGLKPPEHVELLRRLGIEDPPLDISEAEELLVTMLGEKSRGNP